jgi:FKBP-type peptidyl-prolyl cis-trans isomerase FkpA
MRISIKKSFLVSGAFCFFLFSSCNTQPSDSNHTSPGVREMKEGLLGANTLLIDAEEQEIQDFIDRHGWEMNDTGSGLKYMIYHSGNGEKAEKDKIAYIHYTVRLITGDLIYSSHQDGLKNFRIGRGGVESGLEEGILLLRKGDKARFIMPSHLAHGVPGDGVKIPRRATIVYDLELVDLK